MGKYVNPKNTIFNRIAKTRNYVDKTNLIEFTNERIDDIRPLICFSRPRRFGKTMAAQMLAEYYSKGCNSIELFSKFKIASSDSFERELNKNNVIYLDIRAFCGYCSRQDRLEQVVKYIQTEVINELRQIYPEFVSENAVDLPSVLYDIYVSTDEKFIVIIDEWDCLFREDKNNTKIQDEYIDFLRGMFKDGFAEAFIKLAYITGILPIKKYGTQSALNNFREYTMVEPMNLAEYVGFTETEVRELCIRYNMDFDECKQWYDGYSFDDVHSVYSPNSVMTAMENHKFGSYWTSTETYESLKFYIDTDFDDIRTKILSMLAGETVQINPRTFQNDMKNMQNSDDVLTLLIHLGYLAYNNQEYFAYIPNEEVRREFITATMNSSREELSKIIRNSDELIKATLRMNGDEVARCIQNVHQLYTSPDFYNNEQSLRMIIMLAYVSRVDDYFDFQELPSGKGYADILFFPRKKSRKPALLIELKWNKSSGGAIEQIKAKNYCDAIKSYGGEILLVGINYNEKTKEHTCMVEKFENK